MKKGTKRLLISLGVIIAALAAVQLSVSPIVKNYINTHGQELLGRDVKVEKLWINLFNTSISAQGITIREADSDEEFISCGSFSTRMKVFPLFRERFIISRIAVEDASVRVIQSGDQFNFDDIMARFDDGDTTATAETSSWDVGIYNIDIVSSSIYYSDLGVGSHFDMKHITVGIPGFYLSSEHNTDVGLKLDFQRGGSLTSQIEYDYAQGLYDLTLTLENFSMEGLLPYFQQYMNVSKVEGHLAGQVRVKGNTEHVMDMDVSGTGALRGFGLWDDHDREVIAVDSVTTVIGDVNLGKGEYLLRELMIYGPVSHYEIYADSSHCFASLMKDIPEDPADTIPMKMEIGKLAVTGGTVRITDNTPHEPFCYTLSGLEMTAENLCPDRHCSLTAGATLQGSGKARIHWSGNPSDTRNHNITIELRNMDMTHFSPYTVTMFGYPFAHGVLSYTGQNVIRNNQLQGTNHIDIHNPKLDKKRKDVKAQHNVPLRTGLYILTDRSGRMKMDVPVSGDISSPKFSYGHIITTAIVGTLVKVVLSPAKYLSDALGMSDKGLEFIDIDPAQGEFTSEQYDKFTQLCNMVKAKPELKLTMTHKLDMVQALPREALSEMKRNFYLHSNPDKADMALEMLDTEAALAVDSKSKALAQYADSLLAAAGKPVRGDITAKSVALYADAAKVKLAQRAEVRNTLLISHMTTKMGLADSMLSVRSLAADSMALYKGRHCYAVGLVVGGDAVPADMAKIYHEGE